MRDAYAPRAKVEARIRALDDRDVRARRDRRALRRLAATRAERERVRAVEDENKVRFGRREERVLQEEAQVVARGDARLGVSVHDKHAADRCARELHEDEDQ